ncbi:urease accessory protein UreF [Kocuria sp.]|uniref:urease accessory protein UreF n=1 Tax=Kocuria sp. TaxID=1871328 RepID=UPI0026E09B36|nr:urease accessory UreF family protein [Kocuria sp.]MDO5618902.1 urease accessory UreF family protein [Kocuria sp.]
MTVSLDSGLLTMLQFSDSALPTGAFSQSLGLETAINDDVVHDEPTFHAWLRRFLLHQLVPADGWAIRAVAHDRADPVTVDAMLHAMSLPVQIREANAAMGRRAVQIAAENFPVRSVTDYARVVSARDAVGSVPVVLALLAREHGTDWQDTCAAHLFTSLTALTQNAVRGIPIGQNAGQRVLRAMHPEVARAVERVEVLTEDQVGAVSPALEIDQMRHAWQRARMFMS